MNVHHRRALLITGITVAVDTGLGVAYGFADHLSGSGWHGIYCSTATAETVGCDVAPRGWLAYSLAFAMLLSIVVMVPVVFAFFTTGLTADHVDKRHEEMKDHVDQATEEA